MKRKLVKQGAATMMISLPAKWIQENKLDKGDEVEMIEEGKKIVILNEVANTSKQVSKVNISGLNPLVNRVLMSYYIKGVDELEVVFLKPEEIRDFQKRIINELLGFEIIKQSQNTLLIKDITGTDKQDVNDIIKRIFFILDSMTEELILALEKKQSLEPIIEIDSSVNKFVNFCLRNLNKYGYIDHNKTIYIYSIVSTLEVVGDFYKKIAEEISKDKNVSKSDTDVLRDMRSFLKDFEKILFNFTREGIVKFAKDYKTIIGKINDKSIIASDLQGLADTIVRMNNSLMVMNNF